MSPADDAVRLGRAVQLRRVELGIKRPELARRSGLSYPYVSEIENGLKSPSAKALRQLAEALDLTPAALLDRAESLEEVPGEEPQGSTQGLSHRLVSRDAYLATPAAAWRLGVAENSAYEVIRESPSRALWMRLAANAGPPAPVERERIDRLLHDLLTSWIEHRLPDILERSRPAIQAAIAHALEEDGLPELLAQAVQRALHERER